MIIEIEAYKQFQHAATTICTDLSSVALYRYCEAVFTPAPVGTNKVVVKVLIRRIQRWMNFSDVTYSLALEPLEAQCAQVPSLIESVFEAALSGPLCPL